MVTKLSSAGQIQADIAMLHRQREQLLKEAQPPEYPGDDAAGFAVAIASARLSWLSNKLPLLQRELEAAIGAEMWANQTPADELAQAQARRRLLDDLPSMNTSSVPLLVAEMEQVADWVVDEGMDVVDAIERLKETTDDIIA